MLRMNWMKWTLAIMVCCVCLAEANGGPVPANDLCSNATPLTYGVVASGDTTGATGVNDSSCAGTSDTLDVWHEFTPNEDGSYVVDTLGSTLDTTLAVLDGCPPANELACNDDYCDPQNYSSRVIVPLQSGQTYLIRVAGAAFATGAYNLRAGLAGDVNLDGSVDLLDLAEFNAVWEQDPTCSLADIDLPLNNDVDGDDVVRLSDQWLIGAEWVPPGNYQLDTSVSSGWGAIAPPSGPQAAGSTVVLLADPCSGWQVSAWLGTDNDGSTDPCNLVTMSGAKSVSVSFEEIAPVNYLLDTSVFSGWGAIAPPSGLQPAGSTVVLLADPCDGWFVQGWTGTLNDASTDPCNLVLMDGPKSVSVTFHQPGTFNLTTIVYEGHGTLAPEDGPQVAGSTVNLTADPDVGYVVHWWSGTNNDASTALTNAVTMTSDKVVYVKFTFEP